MKNVSPIHPRLHRTSTTPSRYSNPWNLVLRPETVSCAHGFARQVEFVNEFHNFNDIRGSLHSLERSDQLRQFADGVILRDAIFTANLALHFALAEGIRAVQHPAEHRVMLWRRRLRVGEAKQVAVRPAIALLILHRLMCESVGFTFHVPTRNGVTKTATPATHSIHVFREVE